ncbi:MAG: M43 family zinc metalloprotease [Chitinophagales bacterium]
MKKKVLVLFIFLCCYHTFSKAENVKKCGTDEVVAKAVHENPLVAERMAKIETHTQEWIAKNKGKVAKMEEVLTIPVVVHVISTISNSFSNISDEQVYSQIDALNEIFRRQNADAANTLDIFQDVAADMELEFCLAQQDPNGYPTTGITRTSTSIANFDIDDMKFSETGGIEAWPSQNYLNIWVVNNIVNNDSNETILGYAYRPGSAPSAAVDGLAIVYYAFGTTGNVSPSYDAGKTGAHEIGHYLNLMHPWGGSNQSTSCNEDDEVEDTPRTSEPNFICLLSLNQCSNESPDLPDMVQNYMDYADDACSNLFTLGQKERVRAIVAFGGFRYNLAQNAGACQPLEMGDSNVLIENIESPFGGSNCSVVEPVVEFQNFGVLPLLYVQITYAIDGGAAQNFEWTGELQQFEYAQVTLPGISVLNAGVFHEIAITLQNPNAVPDFDPTNNSLVAGFATVSEGEELPITEDFNTDFAAADWQIINDDNVGFEQNSNAGALDSHSAMIQNLGYNSLGAEDEIIFENINLNASATPALEFYVAYSLQNEADSSDVLQLIVSVDCGENFYAVNEWYADNLVTTTPTTSEFLPTAEQWKKVVVPLQDFAYARNASIGFRQIRGEGNNLYLDDINFGDDIVGIKNTLPQITETMQVYPNPTSQTAHFSWQKATTQKAKITIIDNVGRVVKQMQVLENQKNIQINVANISAGLYFVKLENDNYMAHTKMMIAR